jgi:hypothetical protein
MYIRKRFMFLFFLMQLYLVVVHKKMWKYFPGVSPSDLFHFLELKN